MQLQEDISLANYSTMGLGGRASYLTEVTTRQEVKEAVEWAKKSNQKVIMIGSGSNIVWKDEGFQGLIIVNRIKGFDVLAEDELNYYVTIGAGENWDDSVEKSVAQGLTGIEALSLIPGTAGATPVQNVGAYGQEIAQTLMTVEAYDQVSGQIKLIRNDDCGFGYRTSRFKTNDKDRFLILAITLHLIKGNPEPPFYASVEGYFKEHGITDYTPQALRQAVIAIRTSKLPDPNLVHNCGSFFANPVITDLEFAQLSSKFDMVPHWPAGKHKVKLSAAWLIEQVGYKDLHDPQTGMSTWAKQPLVLVNEKAKSTADLLNFKAKITAAVKSNFNITLQQEPELLPLSKI